MRQLTIPVHNNQQLECFIERHGTWFEFRLVGEVDGARQVLSHYLTHDDLEHKFAYAEDRPFSWVDASRRQLPAKKHKNSVQWEATIAQHKFVDLGRGSYHIVPPIGFLSLDRSAWNRARKLLVGHWSDGKIQITFERSFRVRLDKLPPRGHALRTASSVLQEHWSLKRWWLFTYSGDMKVGVGTPILCLNSDEMHLPSHDPRYMAQVFRRQRTG